MAADGSPFADSLKEKLEYIKVLEVSGAETMTISAAKARAVDDYLVELEKTANIARSDATNVMKLLCDSPFDSGQRSKILCLANSKVSNSLPGKPLPKTKSGLQSCPDFQNYWSQGLLDKVKDLTLPYNQKLHLITQHMSVSGMSPNGRIKENDAGQNIKRLDFAPDC